MRSIPAVPVLLLLLTNAGRAAPVDHYGDPLPPRALARLGTVRFRDRAFLSGGVFSPDGKMLAASGYQGAIVLYEAATGRKLRSWKAATNAFPSLAFAPDSKTLASADMRTIQLWDPATGQEIRRFGIKPAQRPPRRFYGFERLVPLVFAHDGTKLASADAEFVIHIWDANTGKELVKLPGHRNLIACLAFAADDKTLFSASGTDTESGSMRVWEVSSGKELRKFPLPNPDGMASYPLSFPPDGKTLIFAAHSTERLRQGNLFINQVGYVISFLDLTSGETRRRLLFETGRFKEAIVAPDGKNLATLRSSESIRVMSGVNHLDLWDMATGKRLFAFPPLPERQGFAEGGPNLLAFAPDGKTLAAASGAAVLHVWDVNRRESRVMPQGHNDFIQGTAFSPDGRTIATVSSDRTLLLWDAATTRPRLRLRGPEGAMTSVAFSPDGKRIAAASSGREQNVCLWDAESSKELHRYKVPMESIGGNQSVSVNSWVAFAAGGKLLAAAGSDRHLRLWDAATGKEVRNAPPRGLRLPPQGRFNEWWSNRVWDMAFTADGRLLALYAARTLSIVDVASGQALFQHEVESMPTTTLLALSPDGKTLLRGAAKTIWLLETVSGKTIHKRELPASVYGAAFSPDGRMAAISAGEAGATLHLLDVATGKELLRLQGHNARVRALAFSPDGTKLVSGQWDSTALIWDVAAARRPLPRTELTAAELDRLWTELRDIDAARAHAALWTLAAAPEKSVPFLKAQLHPVPRLAAERPRQLLADLDAEDFARREKASHALLERGTEVEPALRRILDGKPSLETRRRVEALLRQLPCQMAITPDGLRQLRAIEVLEQIGTMEAREILTALSAGTPAAPGTRDAAAALARLRPER